jgi:hypothetical protein
VHHCLKKKLKNNKNSQSCRRPRTEIKHLPKKLTVLVQLNKLYFTNYFKQLIYHNLLNTMYLIQVILFKLYYTGSIIQVLLYKHNMSSRVIKDI